VRGVESSPSRRRVVSALASMCKALGAKTIAEGVTSAEERDALLETGCELFQGPLLSRLATAPRRTPFPGSLDR
jgi:EAL domain-containing protein (putative c-di-GMP-specific phosphodiesterase class I)